jgi:hypothetical protein
VHTHNDCIIDALFEAVEEFSVVGFRDPTSGLPALHEVGDAYIATETANDWTDEYIYSWDGEEWVATAPRRGMLVWVDEENEFFYYGTDGWQPFAVSTHNHSRLVLPGTSTAAVQIVEDGIVFPLVMRKLRLTATSNIWQTWSGTEWIDSGASVDFL